MARKPALTIDALTDLGADKLARLVFDEVERNSAFKKLVAAAHAGVKGPQAVVALVDRRLSALERAKGFVAWDKAKAFAADLGATVKTIVDELGKIAPRSPRNCCCDLWPLTRRCSIASIDSNGASTASMKPRSRQLGLSLRGWPRMIAGNCPAKSCRRGEGTPTAIGSSQRKTSSHSFPPTLSRLGI